MTAAEIQAAIRQKGQEITQLNAELAKIQAACPHPRTQLEEPFGDDDCCETCLDCGDFWWYYEEDKGALLYRADCEHMTRDEIGRCLRCDDVS